MHSSRARLLLTIAVMATALSATADTAVQFVNFSGPSALYSFQSFNSATGTLNSVSFQISGVVTAQFPTMPLHDGYEPISYPYTITLNQGFTSFSNSFSSLNNSQWISTGMATGTGVPISIAVPFTYIFTFDSVSQFSGFANTTVATGPTIPNWFFSGQPSIFVDAPFVLGSINLTYAADGSLLPIPPGVVDQVGTIQVTYDYTPPAPQPTPEPASVLLLAGGIIGIALKRRL